MSGVPAEAIRLVNGFRGYQLVVAACRLGLPDLLASGPATSVDLAARTGMNPDAMHRFLRGLVAWGFLAHRDDGTYASTPVSDAFRSDGAGMRNMALMLNEEAYATWAELGYSLRTGLPAFDHVHGRSRWEHLAEHPEEAARFNAAMVETSVRVAREVVAAYDFADVNTVVDVGGGNGALLAGVLAAHPRLRGVLFDLPAGLAGARATMEAAGVDGRVALVEGSFLEAVPPGGDVYLLKSIVHDWDDERATTILTRCREAMSAASRVLIVERFMPERVSDPDRELGTVMSDLHMMVLLGGRERTTSEYEALLAAAGLRLTQEIALASDFYMLEAVIA